MKMHRSLLLATAIAPLFASTSLAQSLAISLGVRETGTSAGIGENGGSAGSIEFIRKDAQFLQLDGTWQKFEFNFGTDPVASFVGNGTLDGTRGTLEHIRILNSASTAEPIAIYIDDIVNTVSATDTTLTDFEAYTPPDPPPTIAVDTGEVMFNNPRFSGSTQTMIAQNDTAYVSNAQAHAGSNSYRTEFQWVSTSATNWVRLTTFGVGVLPNPTIDFTPGNKLSFWLYGQVVEPSVRWIATGSGNYTDTANWNNGTVANSTNAAANFLSAATGNATITIDAPVRMNLLRLKNSNSYYFEGSDPNTFTLTGGAGATASINVELGHHTINAPVRQLDRGLQVTVAAGASLTIAQPILQQTTIDAGPPPTLGDTNTLSMTKLGAGQLNVKKINAATLTVNETGTLTISNDSDTSRITFLSMASVGTVTTGRFDIGNNAVVYDIDDGVQTTHLNTTLARTKNAWASGAWTGTGVTSSAALAAAATPDKTGIAVVLASDYGIIASYDGIDIAGDSIILKYALVGDVDLDGKVNTLDFNVLAGNFQGGSEIRWSKGDFDYDQDVDSIDFNAFVANYGKALAPAPLGAVVPEPASLGVLALSGMTLLRRRRAV